MAAALGNGAWARAVQRRGNRPAHILLQKAIDLLYSFRIKFRAASLDFLGI